MSVEVTVFTPTYNRGYIIHNLYNSLRAQTNKNFEWIVIDDGSVDHTELLFKKWIAEENGFEIKYRKVENGGKHRAINKAVDMASAGAFFIVDSDDYLVGTAIDRIVEWFNTVKHDSTFAGISGLKGKTAEQPYGGWGNFDTYFVDATNLERKRYGLLKDKAEVYKTSILKKYHFPEFEGENFITEGVVWGAIARDGYKLRWYKEVIYICSYLEDGLTRSGYAKYIDNPDGTMAWINLQTEIHGEEYGIKKKFRFYFALRNRYDRDKAQKVMKIDWQLAEDLETRYMSFLKGLEEYFKACQIENIAIYGMGNVGNIFLEIAPKVPVKVKYGIDKNKREMDGLRIISPNEPFEEVEAVLITLIDYDLEVEKVLKEKGQKVVYWKDISNQYWYE